ncbi:MAG: hypothetical protein IT302_02735 [Dehalococcoidia bacterium]|nr:hypothetical protein [Dehalococcoidia bacterium]
MGSERQRTTAPAAAESRERAVRRAQGLEAAEPGSFDLRGPVDLLGLQRAIGNQAVQRRLAAHHANADVRRAVPHPVALLERPLEPGEELEGEYEEAEGTTGEQALSPGTPPDDAADGGDGAGEADTEHAGDGPVQRTEAVQRDPGDRWDRFKAGARNFGTKISTGASNLKTKIGTGWANFKAGHPGRMQKLKKGGKKFLTGQIVDDSNKGSASTGKKVGQVAMAIGEGALNAFIAPVNPRWWAKAVLDIKGIKAADYGGGTIGKVLAVLSGSSQVAQKVATIAGILGLALGIAGTLLAAAGGAGAGLLVGATICSLIAMIANGAAFVIQGVLLAANAIRAKAAGSMSTDQKARMWKDFAALIGSALGVIAGGLGTNFGSGSGGLGWSSGTDSVVAPAVSNVAKGWDQVASQGVTQPFGTIGDLASESVGVFTKKDPALAVQRDPEEETESEGEGGGGVDVPGLLAAIGPFLGATDESKSQARTDKAELEASLEATEETKANLEKPVAAVGGDGKKAEGSDAPLGESISSAPAKLTEAAGQLDESAAETGSRTPNEEKLAETDQKLRGAEQQLGLQPGGQGGPSGQKPSMLSRAKMWLMRKFLNIKKRIKAVIAKAKAKFIGMVTDMLGISKKVGDLKTAVDEGATRMPQGITDAEETETGASEAEAKATEVMETLNKG